MRVEPQRVAVFTMDIEPDYGGLAGVHYRSFADSSRFADLHDLLASEAVEPTQFIVADITRNRPDIVDIASSLGGEMELHSYDHPTGPHDLSEQARLGAQLFEDQLGRRPRGYRSPFGRITESDYQALKDLSFEYSSSVFPTLRPGIANHANSSLFPEYKGDELWELPLACLPRARAVLSLSYLKFFGKRSYRLAMAATGLPSVVIIDSHLHDFIPSSTLNGLRSWRKLRYLHHKNDGIAILKWLILLLKSEGYCFRTAGWLAKALSNQKHPVHDFSVVPMPMV